MKTHYVFALQSVLLILLALPGRAPAQTTSTYVDTTNAERTLVVTDDGLWAVNHQLCPGGFPNDGGWCFVGKDSIRFVFTVLDARGEVPSTTYYNVDKLKAGDGWLNARGTLKALDYELEDLLLPLVLMNDMGQMISNIYFPLPVNSCTIRPARIFLRVTGRLFRGQSG